MDLFSKKNKETFFTPLWVNNPVATQVLGIYPKRGKERLFIFL